MKRRSQMTNKEEPLPQLRKKIKGIFTKYKKEVANVYHRRTYALRVFPEQDVFAILDELRMKLEKQIEDAKEKFEGKMVGDMETQYWRGYKKAKEEDLEALK